MTKLLIIILIVIIILIPTVTLAYNGGPIIIGFGPRIEEHNIPERIEEMKQRVKEAYERIQKRLEYIGGRLNLFLRFG